MTVAPDENPGFGELLDDVLTQVLEGEEPDLDALAARYPDVAHRIDEALALAGSAAGRRSASRPSLRGYEIVREIGRGGMGTVYLARQKALDREVALKVLPHSIGLSPRSRPRFLAEARALAKVVHENIVGIHGIVDEGDVLAFEMEFVEGPSLQQLLDHLRAHREATGTQPTLAQIADRLGLPVAELGARTTMQFFVRLAWKIAQALGAVHAAGLVHRDVKPSNILLRRNGQPVLVDFGLVRLANREFSRTGNFAGTPVYSAPEQLRGEADVGPPADVYALGVTIYECIALCTPFPGRTTTDQLRRIEGGLCQPLRRAAPGTPRDLDTIVTHAMEPEPRNRYGDGNTLADDLQRLLDLQPIQARPPGPLRRLGKYVRRNRNSLFAACLGAAAVVAAMVPIIDQIEARDRRRELALAHVHAAQQQLISIESRHLVRRSAGRAAAAAFGTTAEQASVAPLRDAIAEYESAVQLDPDNAVARRELGTARIALRLRSLGVTHRRAVDAELGGAGFQADSADLGPLTIRGARSLARGKGDAAPAAGGRADAAAEDLMTLGLLGFLVGDFHLCEEAWRDLPPPLSGQPIVDAVLGLIHRSDDMPDLAYVRLQQAQRHYPDSAALALGLAEVAVELADFAMARHWLQVLRDDEATRGVRQRLELDLRAAATPDEELAAGYRELVRLDPGDPTPRHRLAQLAARRGYAADAARELDALLAEWPQVARFRLDRARLALQQHDLAAYGAQVLAALDLPSGAALSRGSAADLLEILRIGGLTDLYRRGLEHPGLERSGRAALGGEIAVRTFVPHHVAAAFEQMAPVLHEVARRARGLRSAYEVLDGTAGDLFVSLPMLAARLPVTVPGGLALTRLLLLAVPRAASVAYPHLLPLVWHPYLRISRTWTTISLEEIERPADLPEQAAFGSRLLGIGDVTGDGVGDLLVGSPSDEPLAAASTVQIVDGASGAVIDTLVGESDEHLFGFALAAIGDVDGDGHGDWLFGAPAGTPETRHGTAEIWSGRERRVLFRIEGGGPAFGVAVAGLGDVDGDGTGDFAIASPPLLLNTAAQGSAEIRSGRTGAVLHTLRNDVAGVWFGGCIANAGDADGDGADDLVVGGNYGNARGLVRLYSSRTGAVLQSWADPSTTSGFGNAVLGAGDVDRDRKADVLVTAARFGDSDGLDQVLLFSSASGQRLATFDGDEPGIGLGRALALYVIRGGITLLATGAPQGGESATGVVEFWTLRGQKVGNLLGPVTLGSFGAAIATGDDTDGDGNPELFIAGSRTDLAGTVWRLRSKDMPFLR